MSKTIIENRFFTIHVGPDYSGCLRHMLLFAFFKREKEPHGLSYKYGIGMSWDSRPGVTRIKGKFHKFFWNHRFHWWRYD